MPRPFAAARHAHPVLCPIARSSVQHVRLELDLDLAGAAAGRRRSTLTLTCRRDDVAAVELHAVDMTIDEVTVDGAGRQRLPLRRPAAARRPGQAARPGRQLVVAVALPGHAPPGAVLHRPRRGPPGPAAAVLDAGTGRGQPALLAGHRPPVEKATSEVICTAPRGLFVLSNGELREREDLDERPHPLALRPRFPPRRLPGHAGLRDVRRGRRARARDRRRRLLLRAARAREADARRSFGPHARDDRLLLASGSACPTRTARYSQIAVQRLHLRRHGEHHRHHPDRPGAARRAGRARPRRRGAGGARAGPPVVGRPAHLPRMARGLAERGLRHLLRIRLARARPRPRRGRPRAAGRRRRLPGRGGGRYQRPVVCRQYDEPIELFDAHLYEKGGRVLHMLRHELGDDPFWLALRHVRRETRPRVGRDPRSARAIEDATGRNLDGFFDQWIGSAGHPELEGSWQWDADRGVGRLRLEQKQEPGTWCSAST